MANKTHATAEEARELAESSREKEWAGRSFVKELFLGNLRVDWIDPFPETPDSPEFTAFYARLRDFLENEVDSVEIERTGEYPPRVLQGLREMGAFGMKIKKAYGGLGFSQVEYCKALELLGAHDGSIAALLSAHQSIGIPSPLQIFGTDEQKQKYLPRCAAGAISAFALTEPDVGSDPARLASTAVKNEAGDYVINGVKLWCTNGTIAEVMVVMARDPETRKISAFIVEADSPGIVVEHRCHFLGLKALANAQIRFTDVVVPKENLIGKEGMGLKIALTTLNTGRLSLPAACVGGTRKALQAARVLAAERVQWGAPVGKHEAITHKLADLAATAWAQETLSRLASELSLRDGYDIRLEASVAKEYVSTRNWDAIDTALQIRGGRGYETEASLAARGERPIGIERLLRDARINRIFEGSSEIMHLFMAREALDKHLQVAWDLLDPKAPTGKKLAALPKIGWFYATWYPKLWLGFTWFRHGRYGKLAKHVRYAERATKRLARGVFHGMVRYQAGLERKQAFLFRAVDVAMEILVMTACVTRAQKLLEDKAPEAEQVLALTELHCQNAERAIERSFRDLWANDDADKYRVGLGVLEGAQSWVERDVILPEAPAADGPVEALRTA